MGEAILIAEDEDTLRSNISAFLGEHGHTVRACSSGKEALALFHKHPVDIALTDIRLSDMNGLDLLSQIHAESPSTVILTMTAFASIASAVEAFRNGAHDYLVKPFSLEELELKISNIAKYRYLIRQNATLRREIQKQHDPSGIIARSKVIKDILETVRKVAVTNSTVLITGESGTGKELIARAIHNLSQNRDGLLVPINVAAIPENLVESQLFGHQRGAFTGADRSREGAFRAAEHGTLFLDEIGELSPHIQPKLLRALEQKEIMPVGSDVPITVDTRIVAATNRDLEEMVEAGTFRQDLLLRMNVVNIRIPPLRERVEDIPVLAHRFIHKYCHELGKPVLDIGKDAMQCLMSYHWRMGNVRELSNVIERAVIMCEGDTLELEDLPSELYENNGSAASTLKDAVRQFEYRHIVAVLEGVGGNRDMAAQALGVSPATLYRHMGSLGLKGY